jgi:hypothetical protein
MSHSAGADDAADGALSAATSAPLSLGSRLWPFALIAIAGLFSRWQYIRGDHEAFGSGDANLVLTRAHFILRWELEPTSAVGAASGVFSHPPLIPLLLAGFSKGTSVPLGDAPVIVGPLVALAGLFALYAVVARAFDRTVAAVSTVLVALLPRYAFDSTEPDKVIYVVSFFLVALFFLNEGQRRSTLFLAAGLFMGLAVFSYTTALLFLPVYALSHVALSRGDWRIVFDRYALVSVAIVAAFFAAYVALDNRYSPSLPNATGLSVGAVPPISVESSAPVSPVPSTPLAPPEGGGSWLPEQFESYWRNLRGLAEGGFRDSAWNLYFDGIREQALTPVYAAAIVGFAIGLWLVVRQRRFEIAPLLLWMAIVTLALAIQPPAPSHPTRYPSYVTPVFVVMAVFGVFWAARQIVARLELQPAYAVVVAAPLLGWAAFSYMTAPEQGSRQLYAQHVVAARFMVEEDLLSDDAHVLYLGWPSYTWGLLDAGANVEHLHTFGWRPANFNAARVDPRVRYYLYDDFSEDYFNSGERMRSRLQQLYRLDEIASFCTAPRHSSEGETCIGRVRVYELFPRVARRAT